MSNHKLTVVIACMLAGAALSYSQPKKLTDVEGIGPAYEQKLMQAGIQKPMQLHDAASTRKGREELAAKTGISATLLLNWVNRIDLARVKGVGTQYADLLEKAGVDSPKELARRNAANLMEQLKKTNDEKKLVRKLPTEKQVEGWIKAAKSLKSGAEE